MSEKRKIMAKICLDPGHGGSDSGGTGWGRKEKADVLDIALRIKKLLEAQGVSVIMTRTTDKDITIAQRASLANKEECDYFLSIHRDAFADASANGSSMFIYSGASAATEKKAKTIYDAVIKAAPFRKRGLKKGAANYKDYGVNKNTTMSAALLELGFITNKGDNAIFELKKDAIALEIAKALCSIVGVAYKVKTVSNTESGDKKVVYTVQAGAFSVKKNAETQAAKLKAAGFDAIIVKKE
jgi:N-acetylmuramoyl-L-alanine amidase